MKKIIYILIVFLLVISCTKKEKDVLVYNLMSEPRSLDLHLNTDAISRQISSSLYEGLLKINENGKIDLGIAKEYEKIDNKYIFTLKENLKYYDGTEIKIEDVKNSMLRILNKETKSQYASYLFYIKNAERYFKGEAREDELGIVVENDKLILELEKDVSYFPFLLTLPISVPYNEGKYNGPYMLVSKEELEINLTKNPYYYNKENVEIENIRYIYFNDYITVNNLIKNGDIDISNVDKELLNEVNVETFLDGRIWYFDFNLENEKFSNINLRKAISLAIDRNKYVEYVKVDGSKVAYNVISEKLNYIPKYFVKEDIQLAKESIEKYKQEMNLDEVKLELLVGNTNTEIKEATFIKEELEKNLGISVDVNIKTFKDRLALIREGKYDIALNTWSPKYRDGLAILDRFIYKNKKINNENHKIFKQLLEEARISQNDRNTIINEAEKILLENYFIAPLYFSVENKYISDKYTNVVFNEIGSTIDISYLKLKNR